MVQRYTIMVLVKIPRSTGVSEFITEEFQKVKEQRRKLEEIERQIQITIKELSRTKEFLGEEKTFKEISQERKEWFEVYRNMTTSGGFLLLSGSNAQENEKLVSKYLEDDDLFFHSDIHGASACILKTKGIKPSENDLLEAAQFAACYSSAWKNGFGVVDVYCVKGSQVSKHSHGEVVNKGGFVMKGERNWFRNTELKLVFSKTPEGKIIVDPYLKNNKGVILVPGRNEKKLVCENLLLKLKTNTIDVFYKLVPGNSEFLKN